MARRDSGHGTMKRLCLKTFELPLDKLGEVGLINTTLPRSGLFFHPSIRPVRRGIELQRPYKKINIPDWLANLLTEKKLNLSGFVQLACLGRHTWRRSQNTWSSSSHFVSFTSSLRFPLSSGFTHLICDSEKFWPPGQHWPKGEQLLSLRDNQSSITRKEHEPFGAGLRLKTIVMGFL